MACTTMAQYDEAITATDHAMELGFDESEARVMRADTYESKGSIGKAIREFSALSRNPEYRAQGLLGRARMLMQIGDLDQALDDANQAITASPDDFAYCIRGNVYRARGELAKSIDDYTRADRLCPNSTEVLENRAQVYELVGRIGEAAADRAAVQSAQSGDTTRDEAKAFLSYLLKSGVRVKIAPNARDLEVTGAKLKNETLTTLQRLKPQLLELLRD